MLFGRSNYCLDIPNVKSTKLDVAFKKVMFPHIKSTLLLAILYLDVHQLLSMHFPTTIYHADFIQSLSSSVTSITIPNWTCNDPEYTQFDFSRFTLIESIEVGNDCFGFVKTFCLDGFQRLQTLKIGSNSFTQSKHDNGNDPSKSFHVRNCQLLQSIEISEFSFADFAGQFELKSLPSLESIKIGTIGSKSYNFYYSSFVIQGIVLFLSLSVDLPHLKSVSLGEESFCYSLSTQIESMDCEWLNTIKDLPSLQSIELGEYALWGLNDANCKLVMRSVHIDSTLLKDLPELVSLQSSYYSFYKSAHVTLESRMNVKFYDSLIFPISKQYAFLVRSVKLLQRTSRVYRIFGLCYCRYFSFAGWSCDT